MPDPIIFDAVTPRMSLPLLFAAQAQKELFHNEALARIDALLHPAVEDETNEPPQSPQEGESWLIAGSATGVWAGREQSIATFQNGGWIFTAAHPGMQIYDQKAQQTAIFTTQWQKADPVEEPSGGLNVDSEARAAIGVLISALRAAGIYPPA